MTTSKRKKPARSGPRPREAGATANPTLLISQMAILDALPASVCLIDRTGVIVGVNAAWRQFADANAMQDHTYGVGANYLSIAAKAVGLDAGEAQQATAGIQGVLSGNAPSYTLQYSCHSPGENRWFRLDAILLNDRSGGAAMMHTNVTELVEAREAARAGEVRSREASHSLAIALRRTQNTMDLSLDVICAFDLDGNFVQVSAACEEVWGYRPDELLGTPFLKMVLEEDRPRTLIASASISAGAPTRQFENRYLRKDGSVADIMWSANYSVADSITICVARDVTDRRRIESQLLRAQRMESIGTLAGGVAHDLNNLLAPIIMGVDLLRLIGLKAQGHSVVNDMERSARRGASLVEQVLSFARGTEVSKVSLRIADVIDELSFIMRNTFPKNVSLESKLAHDLRHLQGDPTQIQQVLLNLCVNARDAMPDGGTVTISACNLAVDAQYAATDGQVVPGDYILVEVTDSGMGISKQNIAKVFDPFFTTKEVGQGTGLGLSTALGIVRSHGGFLNVYSEPGHGATFKVYLPVTHEEPTPEEMGSSEEEWRRGKGECILLVDDEVSILAITQQTLETLGYEVLTAENGAKAVSAYAVHGTRIDLVITDMMMPVMDGAATIMALRQIDPRVTVVAASGLNTKGTVTKTAQSGVQHFLSKPYTTRALLNVINEALQVKEGQRQA